MTKHHDLKCFPEHFQPVVDLIKTNEVRINDRDYQVGDTITLHEGWSELDGFHYTGRRISAVISYIGNFGLPKGYVNLSLKNVGVLIIKD